MPKAVNTHPNPQDTTASAFINLNSFTTWILATICTLWGGPAWAWGERGHDLIARAAVRMLVARHGPDHALTAALLQREHWLGHLSNVPDIVWRSADRATIVANSPTHYIDLEYFTAYGMKTGEKPQISLATLPKTDIDLGRLITELCAKPPRSYSCPLKGDNAESRIVAGTAPFRIRQLWNAMKAALVRAKALAPPPETPPATGGGKDFVAAVNDALLHGGLMAHFVGDLAQPLHATADYDGYARGQGGLHNYFETEIVDAFDLALDHAVEVAASEKPSPLDRLQIRLGFANTPSIGRDPLTTAWALALDSYDQLESFFALDKREAIRQESTQTKGLKIKATRHPAAKVAPSYRDLVVARLALGAATLASLWESAWEEGSKPDLRPYHSYEYPTAPAFVPVDSP